MKLKVGQLYQSNNKSYLFYIKNIDKDNNCVYVGCIGVSKIWTYHEWSYKNVIDYAKNGSDVLISDVKEG